MRDRRPRTNRAAESSCAAHIVLYLSPTATEKKTKTGCVRFLLKALRIGGGLQLSILVDTIVITWGVRGVRSMLELKVRKIGNSLGVVLPKEAVSRLHADEGDRLFLIEGPNGVYQLTPYDPP